MELSAVVRRMGVGGLSGGGRSWVLLQCSFVCPTNQLLSCRSLGPQACHCRRECPSWLSHVISR